MTSPGRRSHTELPKVDGFEIHDYKLSGGARLPVEKPSDGHMMKLE
jgi:hypothetical protein